MSSVEDANVKLPSEPTWMSFLGRPKMGKSYAMRYTIQQIMRSDDPFHFGVVFVKTKFNGEWSGESNFIDDKYVIDNFSVELLNAYMQGLEKWSKDHGNKKHKKNFVILDDLQGLRDPNHPLMNAIVATYRHTNTTFMISAQYLNKGTSTSEREVSEYNFMFNVAQERSMKSWHACFGTMCDSYDEFVDLLKSVTADAKQHNTLLFIQGADSKEKSYFKWKAGELDPNFKVIFPSDKKRQQEKQ